MARKDKLSTTSLDTYGSSQSQDNQVRRKTNVSEKSIANLHPRAKIEVVRKKKFMQLDIIEFEDYLNRMSKYKKMTRTKYILSLIRADMELHEEEYEALKNLSAFDSNSKS